MKLSIGYYPHGSVAEAVATAVVADELGYHGWYVTDSSYRKDPWVILGTAAIHTERIRLGPGAARAALTDPLVLARAIATLDELSGGRVDTVVGIGGPRPHASLQALPFMREYIEVLRKRLAAAQIHHDGHHFSYHHADMPLTAQPRQSHMPIWYGSMGGPKLMSLAGEIADGVQLAPAYTRAACDYLVRQATARLTGGRGPRELDLAVCPVFCCGPDGDAARTCARIHLAFYLRHLTQEFFEAINDRGAPFSAVSAVARAWRAGDLARAAKLVTPELADMFAVAGTPQECAEQLAFEVTGSGVNHVVLMVADRSHMRMILGAAPVVVPDVADQLRLIGEHVRPALGA